jgi:hypothetical protein
MQGSATVWLEITVIIIAKIIIPANQQIVNVIGDLAGIIPRKN